MATLRRRETAKRNDIQWTQSTYYSGRCSVASDGVPVALAIGGNGCGGNRSPLEVFAVQVSRLALLCAEPENDSEGVLLWLF